MSTKTYEITPEFRQAIRVRVKSDPDHIAHPANRSRLRLAVARALAAEGVVVAPDRWARMVRDLVDDLAEVPGVDMLRDLSTAIDLCQQNGDNPEILADLFTAVRAEDRAAALVRFAEHWGVGRG